MKSCTLQKKIIKTRPKVILEKNDKSLFFIDTLKILEKNSPTSPKNRIEVKTVK